MNNKALLDALKETKEQLEESNSLLVALLHEIRSHDEITQQILDNRGAINSVETALSTEREE
jgi:hypothetical protein